jgi:cation transporter-like permease
MMDLREVWKRVEAEKLSLPVAGAVEVRKTSKHPVAKLKRAYLISTAFALVFLIGFIVLFFTYHEPLVKGSLVLVIVGYIFFFVVNFSMYRKINVALPVDQSLRKALAHTYDFITDNIRFQERVGLYLYPIAAASGFLMGGASGGDLDAILQKKVVLIILLVTVAILTPIGFYLARWMYRVSYGKCLIEIKGLINELDNPL